MVGRTLKINMKKLSNKAKWIVVIRFKSEDARQILVIPTSEDMDYPFTAHGFTAGIKGRIGVPEFTIPRGLGVSIEDGTEIWKITRDGRQTLYAVFENKTFKIVDQWK